MNYKTLSKILKYSGPTTEEDFHKLLDANPDDHTTRMVFADWLQEHNDPRAEGYRALGKLKKKTSSTIDNKYAMFQREGIKTSSSHLPSDWYNLIEGEDFDGMKPRFSTTSKEKITRRAVEDAAALAFSKLPPERREELLK